MGSSCKHSSDHPVSHRLTIPSTACREGSSPPPRSVPASEPQKIGGGVQLSDPPLEDDAARAGHRHAVAGGPGFAGAADELAVSLVVLDEGSEVGEHVAGKVYSSRTGDGAT